MGKVGFFDAGVGGLLVVKEVLRRLPGLDIVYLGDNATPNYGGRTREEIYLLAERGLNLLFTQDCDVVIMTSTTAASYTLDVFVQNYMPTYAPGKELLSLIAPTAAEAARRTYAGNIGVIASEGVVRSGAFATELHTLRPGLRVYQQACPLLISLIETGQQNGPTMQALLRTYLAPLQAANIDVLILGSAQYAFVRPQLSELLGPRVRIIDESTVFADSFADHLVRQPELNNRLTKTGQATFYCTSQKSFDLLASQFYGSPITATQVTL